MGNIRNIKDKIIYKRTEDYLIKNHEKNINKKLKIVKKVLNKKDIEERYSYLYDLLCDYLDNEFKEKNICDFNCGICKKRKHLKEQNIKKSTYINKKNCDHLNNNGSCNIKCLGCKLFTCNYLKKQGYKYRLKDIYLSKYFFNYWQRNFIEYTFRKPKEYVLKGILKRRSRFLR